jgi:Na+/proline symporter
MVKSFSILFVGLIIPMTAAIYWQRCNGPAAVASLVAGMVGWLTFEWLGTTYPPDLMAAAIGLVTLVVVTLATSNRVAPLPLADIDGQQIAYRDRLGTLALPRLGASE